jgi:ParB family chromosome partitioning protein
MAKLEDFTRTAGMNGGAAVYAKMMRPADIQTDPAVSSLFPIAEETLQAIITSMRERGYDKAEPLVIWKGKNIIVDGHTRLKAALETEIAELPVEEKEFEDQADAILYAYGRQANRRNLTQAEIFNAAVALQDKATRDGNGREAERLAKALDIAASTIYRARAVDEKAEPEIIEAVKNGDMSINKAYQQVRKQSKKNGSTTGAHGYEGGPRIEATETEPIEMGEFAEPPDFTDPAAALETKNEIEVSFQDWESEKPDPLDPLGNPDTIAEVTVESQNNVITETGAVCDINRAIHSLAEFMNSHSGEEMAEIQEVILILEGIKTNYITGGFPS